MSHPSPKSLNDKLQVPVDLDGRVDAINDWNHRILIVEDEPGISEAYRDILNPKSSNIVHLRRSSRSAGGPGSTDKPAVEIKRKRIDKFDLVVVDSAEKALAEVKHSIEMKKPFTMGFFDVLLGGGMDGIELVKQIHAMDSEIYAVFVTAYSDRNVDSIQAVLGDSEASQWDYINKPFTQGEILQKARGGVTLWNAKREREIKDEHTANLQRQLFEHERLATMATVARGIGHEFKNILNSIIGKVHLSSNLTTVDALRDQLKNIHSAAKRASEVVEKLHYLHDPSAQKIQKKWLFIDQPIEEALTLLSHELKLNNVRVCWIRRKKSLVFANSTGLMQVFVNLFINAIHAMGNPGIIDISIAEVGEHVEVRVRDYGPGIDRKIIARVTEPFFTTKGENGTGLGLAIVKEIVEVENAGKLILQNHEFKGLEVLLLFPFQKDTNDTKEER